jgi:protein phosphatase
MKITAGARTDPGARDNNEDSLAVLTNHQGKLRADCVMIIADGMGGRAYGERASSAAVDSIRNTLTELLAKSAPEAPPIQDALATALRRANSLVYDLAAENPGKQPMGTTCTTGVIIEDKLHIAHVGDSRAYLLRDDILRPITTDHSYVAEQIRAGQLSDHDARSSRFKNVITKAVGIEPTLQPDIEGHVLRDGDALLFCTDGLSGTIDEAGITQIILQSHDPQTTSDYLVEAAKRAGAKDNISVIVVFIGEPAFAPIVKKKEQVRSLKAVPNISRRPRIPRPAHPEVSASKPIEEETVTARTERFLQEESQEKPESAPRKPLGAPLFVLGLLLGIVAAVASLVGAHIVRLSSHSPYISAAVKAMPKPVAIDLSNLSYAAPAPLLYKPLRQDFIQPAPGGYLVATPQSRLLLVNSKGQVLIYYPTSVSIPAPSAPSATTPGAPSTPPPAVQPAGIAIDRQGDLYKSDPVKRSIDKFRYDGTFSRTIDAGELVNPGALVVAENGDIFLIANGRLTLVRAQPQAANSPAKASGGT